MAEHQALETQNPEPSEQVNAQDQEQGSTVETGTANPPQKGEETISDNSNSQDIGNEFDDQGFFNEEIGDYIEDDAPNQNSNENQDQNHSENTHENQNQNTGGSSNDFNYSGGMPGAELGASLFVGMYAVFVSKIATAIDPSHNPVKYEIDSESKEELKKAAVAYAKSTNFTFLNSPAKVFWMAMFMFGAAPIGVAAFMRLLDWFERSGKFDKWFGGGDNEENEENEENYNYDEYAENQEPDQDAEFVDVTDSEQVKAEPEKVEPKQKKPEVKKNHRTRYDVDENGMYAYSKQTKKYVKAIDRTERPPKWLLDYILSNSKKGANKISKPDNKALIEMLKSKGKLYETES